MTIYEPVIGLEIHAELSTNSKMFCGCRVVDSVEAGPNSAVCPVCLGMPGMLPVINRRAIEFAIRVALALNCTIQRHNVFARKNYFYPDLPKAYQISQYELPLATNGWLDLDVGDGKLKRVNIRRVHMEEDTGKLTHVEENGCSLVDFNRSGVPLLEIVSEPDLGSVKEAKLYAIKIRQILKYLRVNTGDMEKGVIRFEANISLRQAGSHSLGTRTEIKNLNSFRILSSALDFEIQRQESILLGGGAIVQDTLGWSESQGITFSQRGKEEAHDYRYFPEPDLPPLEISSDWISDIRRSLPELPDGKVSRYQKDLGLNAYESNLLTEERPIAEFFESAVAAGGEPKSVAKWMANDLFNLMNENKASIEEIKITPTAFVDLIRMVDDGVVNRITAKEVLAEMFNTGKEAEDIVADKELAQISDENLITEIVKDILKKNPDQLALFLSGKEQIRGWFFGQVMRAAKGKANPRMVEDALSRQLAELQNSES
jgi:aspartyl-tRNA(Asn)/glutamyl-tRNA(Gln) amidotransferase subunit B